MSATLLALSCSWCTEACQACVCPDSPPRQSLCSWSCCVWPRMFSPSRQCQTSDGERSCRRLPAPWRSCTLTSCTRSAPSLLSTSSWWVASMLTALDRHTAVLLKICNALRININYCETGCFCVHHFHKVCINDKFVNITNSPKL